MVTNNAGKTSAKNMARPRRGPSSVSSSSAAGFRLLDAADACDTVSSVSRNSIYKLKIDAMFDDSRSIISHHRQDSLHGGQHSGQHLVAGSVRSSSRTAAHRSASIRSGSVKTSSSAAARYQLQLQQQQQQQQQQHPNLRQQKKPFVVEDDVQRVSNKVQDQIERMFTDVIKDVTSCSFTVKCLGSLPLTDKVTSLLGLQEPLRQLYLSGAGHGNQTSGHLDICASGLRVRLSNGQYAQMTPFHNIAVWSAVKFIVSPVEGGAAFLPLITDPENIDKSSLFKPLSAADKRRLSSGLHSPIFAVVMRSTDVPRQLECHAFVCTSPEDAIVIAATLYQSLMTHMNSSQTRKTRKPRNQNGVSCMSIASSSVANLQQGIAALSGSIAAAGNVGAGGSVTSNQMSNRALEMLRHRTPSFRNPSRPPRKKRSTSGSLSGNSDFMAEGFSGQGGCSTTEERKKKSHKTRRAPPIPSAVASAVAAALASGSDDADSHHRSGRPNNSQGIETGYSGNDPNGGDIFTRVAIPRSGSFLNTSGLTRYKSRATRRAAGKNGVGGGGGRSPLGFSELFNEFRLQENLHSLDDILNAIINFDGMSFNDLKPIYKEFLLKLAVTLTKDELYQRSKSIMRRQKKKKLRRKPSNATQKPRKTYILGSKSLSKVFCFGKHHFSKLSHKSKLSQKAIAPLHVNGKDVQTRIGTSGSDVSVTRNELTLSGRNRNSSSGYVSCSECSYDSEACTCASADRCYCSLVIGHEHVNAKLHHRATGAGKAAHGRPRHRRRHGSLRSCGTEDKCYCSLGERTDAQSSGTTWCDSDSCISQTKCYCQEAGHSHRHTDDDRSTDGGIDGHENGSRRRCRAAADGNGSAAAADDDDADGDHTPDNLALDYELFTVDNGPGGEGGTVGKHVRASEALSVKKSVEMAALFADYKLSQTTDVKNMVKSSGSTSTSSRKSPSHSGSVRSTSTSTVGGRNGGAGSSNKSNNGSSSSARRKTTMTTDGSEAGRVAPDSLNTSRNVSLRKSVGGSGHYGMRKEDDYQTIQPQRPVSATLEDSLGYLP